MLKNILIAVIALGIIGGGIGFYMFNKKVESTAELKVDFSVKMEDLFAEFDKDEKAAFEKFKDKVVEVKGVVASKSDEDKQNMSLVLGSEAMGSGTIGISLEPGQEAKMATVKEGSTIVLRGQCTGVQAPEKSADGEASLLDDLGKTVQMKQGVIVSVQ